MKRRTFVKTAAGTAAATGAGVFSILKHPRDAHATWGEWPEDNDGMIPGGPDGLQVESVLELQFNGGLPAWETFYVRPEWGVGAGAAGLGYLHLFEDNPPAGTPDPRDTFESCGLDAGGLDYTEEFADDIFLGPWTAPLRRRPDIIQRMRVVVMRHDVLAHEGANPITITGSRIGQPRMAGLGAHIQRYFQELPGGARPVPYSYSLFPAGEGFNTFNFQAGLAIGFHPGFARPLNVLVSQNSVLFDLLARPGIPNGYRQNFDAAIDYYLQDYASRLRPHGIGKAVRSTERANYDFAHFARANAEELTGVLTQQLFQPIPGTACVDDNDLAVESDADMSRMQANVARTLLTHPEYPARYVQWVDVGISPNAGAGHDNHTNHVAFASRNIPNTLQALVDIIQDPAQPRDPSLIDLDRTLIVFNMEFGRTPYRQGGPVGTGTNHWPQGYVSVMIGGPIRADGRSGSPGASVYGEIEEADGIASTFATPAENRIMVLSALGIYPFTSQSFAVADVRTAEDEQDAARRIRNVFWGIDV